MNALLKARYYSAIEALTDAHALLYGIGAAGMFDAAPPDDADRALHECGSRLVNMAEDLLQRAMDEHEEDIPVAAPLAVSLADAAWKGHLTEYRMLRAISDAMPADSSTLDAMADRAVDAYCEALDRLIATPAPNLDALAIKISLIDERTDGFSPVPKFVEAVWRDILALQGAQS